MASEKFTQKEVASVIGSVGLALADDPDSVTQKEIEAYRTLVDWYCSRFKEAAEAGRAALKEGGVDNYGDSGE